MKRQPRVSRVLNGNRMLHPSPCLILYSCVCLRLKRGSNDRRSTSAGASVSKISGISRYGVLFPPIFPHSRYSVGPGEES